jgi:hypothetical protein
VPVPKANGWGVDALNGVARRIMEFIWASIMTWKAKVQSAGSEKKELSVRHFQLL